MKNIWLALLVVFCSCSSEKETDTKEKSSKEEVRKEEPESEESALDKLISQIKKDVRDVNAFMPHVRFVISPDCAYVMMLEEEKEFYEEADFKKYYPEIFTDEVIEKLQTVKSSEVEVTRDEAGKMIGFRISLNFSEYAKEAEMNDEWALVLDFLIEDGTYTMFCMRGAG